MTFPYQVVVLGLCVLAFFVTMFARVGISPVVPFITSDFSISNTQIGIALTGMWLAYGLTQFPSGVLAERYGEKPVILISVGGTAIACFALALSPIFAAFALFAIVLGGVAGLHYSVGTMLLHRTWDDIGTAVGVHTVGAPLAGLIAPIAAAWVGVTYGWRPAVAIVIIIALPIFATILLKIERTEPVRPNDPMRDRFELASMATLILRGPVLFTILLSILGLFVLQGLLSFFPTFLVEHLNYSPTMAAVAFSGFFVISAIGRISVGIVSDRYDRDLTIAGCGLIGGIGCSIIALQPSVHLVAVAIIFMAIGTSLFSALDPRFLDLFSDGERSAGFGLVRTVYGVLGALGSFWVGFLSDTAGWGITVFAMAGCLILITLCLMINRGGALNL